MRTDTAFRTVLLLSALALSASGPVPAQLSQEPVLRSAGTIDLRGSGREYALASATGERPVRLPAGVEIEELFALRRGAFLSGRGPLLRDRSPHRDLYLALVDGQGVHELPSPALTTEEGRPSRENAVPLTSRSGDLEGVAWLEGADRGSYVLRAASWDGMTWSQPAVIAKQAPGSQLALAATTLDDGSQLLLWSRFDGHDDEIVAARRVRDSDTWSAPQAIAADNGVPDLTPAVIAVSGGALAAWSRYDGHDYRVVTARFDGEKWSVPSWAGPAGSTAPFFTRSADPEAARSGPGGPSPTWLSFSNAQPRGWEVLELDSSGGILRQGTVPTSATVRPVLAVLPTGDVKMRWAASELEVELHDKPTGQDSVRKN